jgi:hypothetical protein
VIFEVFLYLIIESQVSQTREIQNKQPANQQTTNKITHIFFLSHKKPRNHFRGLLIIGIAF